MHQSFRRWPALLAVLLAGALSACSTPPRSVVYQHEEFDSTSTYSRSFAVSVDATCEAARRALLSQGYLINQAKSDQVEGRKSFQPDSDNHVQIMFRVVCVADPSGKGSSAFVSALEDRYALKKSNNSASLGVGGLGSISLPFTSSDDSLVKVASLTIPAGTFYQRFFMLVESYLDADSGTAAETAESATAAAPQAPPQRN
ncbi:DUF2242 domain-containing protein [Herminiimonas sp. CN]|uniref:DUF2242 domain-containing protein n=1 Tax=Herminiimonas sp. CN TaxID=1349818 RepID=UPI0004733448|nr:DUF2242 domain-containing protein [Herminiimonas sp. CN]